MRIDIKGDKKVGGWYLPVVKSKAADFVARIERAKLKQCRTAFTFTDPPAVAFVQYYFGQVNVQIISPEPNPPIPQIKTVHHSHDMVLVCGDEDIGYVVARMSLESDDVSLFQFQTMNEVMKKFPVANYEELHKFRYSFSTENGASVTGTEMIVDGFETSEPEVYDPGIHILVEYDRTDTSATRCAPPGFTVNSKLDPDSWSYSWADIPCGGTGLSCLVTTPVTDTVLGSVYGGLQLTSKMEYVPRMIVICPGDNSSYSLVHGWLPGRHALQKIDVSAFVNGMSSLTGLNAQAWVLRSENSLKSAINTGAVFAYTAAYADMETTKNPFYDQRTYLDIYNSTGPTYALGAKSVFRSTSPAGPLRLLNDDDMLTVVWDRIYWQFNDEPGWTVPVPPSYPGYPTVYPWNVPFMAPSTDPIYVDLQLKCVEYKAGSLYDLLAREYYSCDTTSIVFGKLESYAPMTQTVDEFQHYPATGELIENSVSGLSHRPCMTCAKNIPLSISLNGTEYNIYVSAFLEATYTYNETDSRYYPSDPRLVCYGACTSGQPGSCNPDYKIPKKIMKAFTAIRNHDLLNNRVQALDPYPCAGATMFYFFDTSGPNYFSDELDCFHAINAYRVQRSVPKVKWDITLTTASRLHLNDLCTGGGNAHVGSDGKNSDSRIMACGCAGWASKVSYISEIIAWGQENGTAAVETWKLSVQGHHEALYTKRHIAVGIAVGVGPGDQKIWVVTFAGDYTLDSI